MTGPLPDELIFNGINASEKSSNRGKYLLTLTPSELEQIALGHTYGKRHLTELNERNRQIEENKFALEFGRDDNNLADAGWGVIFPAKADNTPILAIRDVLKELLDWRKEQAGDLYKEYIGEKGYLPKDTADKFMRRYKASPGTVDPTRLPYYLLLVGDPTEIPYRFQYELDVTYLVGRIHFETLQEYANYAHSVVMAEKNNLRLARRAVFFGPAHAGDIATQLSSTMLVDSLSGKLSEKKKDWQVELLTPEESRKARLSSLLGGGNAPALLFTAGHGVGFDLGDTMQVPFQGALLCQDLESISAAVSRDHYLGAEDIEDNFSLHGLVAFHFACFGAGTPRLDSFTRPDQKKPAQIAPHDFLAGLPRRLLSHPRGGALAVIGHVDRAFAYSFKWGDAGQQTQTFQDTLVRMMSGHRVGLALDQFNIRYAQIAARLTGVLDKAEVIKPELSELAGLWTANNDARGYALFGDPAASIPMAKSGEAATGRQVLAPAEVSFQTGASQPAAPAEGQTERVVTTTTSVAVEVKSEERVDAAPPGFDRRDQETRLKLRSGLKALAIQIDALADDLAAQNGGEAFDAAAELESFAFGGRALDELGEKLRDTMQTLAQRLKEFASDITSLEVRTYVSDQIENENYHDGKFTGGARQRAMTHISLDGDTRIVVPANAGEIDEALWEIHTRAVEQAQVNRAAMLKSIIELLAGLSPGGK